LNRVNGLARSAPPGVSRYSKQLIAGLYVPARNII
jgi:hypothetical protein